MIGAGPRSFVRFGARRAAPRLRLFCFPYAGGSAALYARWHHALPADVDVVAIELPGHGKRIGEACAVDMAALADDLAADLEPSLDRPYAFFGHSLGATLAFACARALRRRGARLPAHLIASGRIAPDRRGPDEDAADRSDADFIAHVRALGGTAPEVLAEPELLALFLPILRADYRLIQSHAYRPEPPLAVPITALAGASDARATPHELTAWRAHTTGPFALHVVAGDHFFVTSARAQVIERVAQILEHVAAPAPSRLRRVP